MKPFVLALVVTIQAVAADETGRVIAIEPEISKLINPASPIEKVTEGFQFTEGPLWSPSNFLLFSDIYGDKIYKWSPGNNATVFRDQAGFPNGLTFDRKGRLLVCEQKQRRLIRLQPDGSVEVVVDQWQDKHLNCPNDIVVRQDGTVYFTDPYWKFPPGAVQELDFQGVFKVSPDGKLSVVAKDFGLPNGIALSPDEKKLYIGDSRRRIIYAFDIASDGTLSGQRVMAELQSSEKGSVDGMKVDELGNIYTTGPGGIWVISSTGQHLGTIKAPEIPANCAWGGSDYKTLFLTAPKSVYKVQTLVRGKSTYSLSVRR